MGKTFSFPLQSYKSIEPKRWLHFEHPERACLLAFWLSGLLLALLLLSPLLLAIGFVDGFVVGFVAFVAFVTCYWLDDGLLLACLLDCCARARGVQSATNVLVLWNCSSVDGRKLSMQSSHKVRYSMPSAPVLLSVLDQRAPNVPECDYRLSHV